MHLAGDAAEAPRLVHGGRQTQRRGEVEAVPWHDIGALAGVV